MDCLSEDRVYPYAALSFSWGLHMEKAKGSLWSRLLKGDTATGKGWSGTPQIAEARRRIARAKSARAIGLDLGGLGLVDIPDKIEQLTWLTRLYLGHHADARGRPYLGLTKADKERCNALTTLPRSVTALPKLEHLDLTGNRLTELPAEIGHLTALQSLTLSGNALTALPTKIGCLTNLQRLDLSRNQLTTLPPDIGLLTALRHLDLGSNRLSTLPEEIGRLAALEHLYLAGNLLTALPIDFSRLTALISLSLSGNPLPQAYLDALKQGAPAFFSYVSGLALAGARRVYEAKLLLTGEGEVGKTWLARALRGERNDAAAPEQSTYGVELGKVQVKARHATAGNIEITLNSWDFGGQKVYRVLHQFFFSGDAIYLLVWKPRMGEDACQLTDWLRRIYLVARESARVILVATHAADKDQRYNPLGILRDVEPHLKNLIVDQIEVDSLTGHNIDALKALVAKHAAVLPRMGSQCPMPWERALGELATLKQRQPILSWQDFMARCAEAGLDEKATRTLAEVFVQQFGRALYFGDRRQAGERAAHLSDLIVLDPLWLSKAITFVLEDPVTIAKGGLLDHDKLTTIWSDTGMYPVTRHPFLLGLMEKLDVSYTVRDHRTMSLIAQLLPQRRPDLPWYIADTRLRSLSANWQLSASWDRKRPESSPG